MSFHSTRTHTHTHTHTHIYIYIYILGFTEYPVTTSASGVWSISAPVTIWFPGSGMLDQAYHVIPASAAEERLNSVNLRPESHLFIMLRYVNYLVKTTWYTSAQISWRKLSTNTSPKSWGNKIQTQRPDAIAETWKLLFRRKMPGIKCNIYQQIVTTGENRGLNEKGCWNGVYRGLIVIEKEKIL